MFHVSMLRLAHDNGAGKRRPPTTMIEGQEEFDLEELLAHRPAHKNRGDSVFGAVGRLWSYGQQLGA